MEKKLEFTDSAKNQIEKITKSEEKKYFRIAVQGGGCSGFKYNFTDIQSAIGIEQLKKIKSRFFFNFPLFS